MKGGDNVFSVVATNKGNASNAAGLVGKAAVVLADGREAILNTDSSWKMFLLSREWLCAAALNDGLWRTAKELGKCIKPMSGPRDRSRDNFRMDEAYWVRKGFSFDAAPEQAMAYVNVKGYYELYVNGQRVGTDAPSPPV